jgi:hypothetical protein
VFQEQSLPSALPRAIELSQACLAPRQEIGRPKQQEKRQQHRCVKCDSSQAGAHDLILDVSRMTSRAIIRRPLIIEMKTQVRKQFGDCWLVLQRKEHISSPSGGRCRTRPLRYAIEVEFGNNWGQISRVVAHGPKGANLSGTAIGNCSDQGAPSLRAVARPDCQRGNFRERVATGRVRPLHPDAPRWDVDQIQTGAQAIAFGISELRGAAHEFVREYIAQWTSADIVFESVRCRQCTAVVRMYRDAAGLRDEIQKSHWMRIPKLRVQNLAVNAAYSCRPSVS